MRLGLYYELGRYAWGEMDGQHLSRLSALEFAAFAEDAASAVAASPHLSGVSELVLRRPQADAVSRLLSGRLRANLRRLTLLHVVEPVAVGTLATGGAFGRLDELTVEVAAAVAQSPEVMFEGADFERLRQVFGAIPQPPGVVPVDLIATLMHRFALTLGRGPTDATAWRVFCESLTTLARSAAGRRLTRFRFRLGEDFLSPLPSGTEIPVPPVPMRTISDDCAAALADGFSESLAGLELPGRLLTPAQRFTLERRWGPRLRVV